MGKYDGISKVNATVSAIGKPVHKKKRPRERSFLFGLCLRIAIVAAFVAFVVGGGRSGIEPLRSVSDFVRRAVLYDTGFTGGEELGYSEIAEYFAGGDEKA